MGCRQLTRFFLRRWVTVDLQQLASEFRLLFFGPTIFRYNKATSKTPDLFSNFKANQPSASSSTSLCAGFNLECAKARNLEISLMKNILVMTLFILATLAWAAAQQTGSAPARNSGQTASPTSQTPGASKPQPSKAGSADQAGSQDQESQAPVTEGCLGGSEPNYTITGNNGAVYKLNMPPNTDTSKLAPHVGEPVQVQGNIKDAGKSGNGSIDVQAIGPGTGSCPASSPKNTQPPPKR
jgi:hypothetical protein